MRAGLAVAGAGILTACTDAEQPAEAFVAPNGDEVRAAEADRHPGAVREFRLTAAAGAVDLGGLTVNTWGYGGAIPGKPVRVRAGEMVRATGVRKGTAIVLPGQRLTASFDADNPGRWMVHCHNVYPAEDGMMTLLGHQR